MGPDHLNLCSHMHSAQTRLSLLLPIVIPSKLGNISRVVLVVLVPSGPVAENEASSR